MPNRNPFSDLNQWIAMLNQVNQLLNSEWFQSFSRLPKSQGTLPNSANADDSSRNLVTRPSQPVSDNPAPTRWNLQEMTNMLNQINQFLNSNLVKNGSPPSGTQSRAANPPPSSDIHHMVSMMKELGNLLKNFRPY